MLALRDKSPRNVTTTYFVVRKFQTTAGFSTGRLVIE